MTRLTDYLPEWYKHSAEMTTIQDAIQAECDELWSIRDDLQRQLDPYTATWGLSYWEDGLGIARDETKSQSQRVSGIVSKLRGRDTTTIEMIKSVCDSFINSRFEVEELFDQYLLRVTAVVTGVSEVPDVTEIELALRELVPAHLALHVRARLEIYAVSYASRLFAGAAVRVSHRMMVACEVPTIKAEQEDMK